MVYSLFREADMLLSPFETRAIWLLVRTKPKQERLAAECLEGRGIGVYYPRILEPRYHIRAARTPMPLFPSYVFCFCRLAESFHALAYCPGVSGPVRFGDLLAAVDEGDVALLRQKEQGRGYLVPAVVRKPPVEGSRVVVVAGPFKGMRGIIERYQPAQNRIRMLMDVVAGVWRTQLGADFVRVA
jgi:transcription antitermination factor NusG